MSTEENQDGTEQHNDAGDDLSSALGGGDETFVLPEKKPVNRSSFVFFAIAMVAVGGYYLMYVRTGPNTAAASAEAVAADKTITTFLKGGDQNIREMQNMLRNTEKEVERFQAYPSVQQVPISELKTNPFIYTSATAKPGDDSAADAKRKAEEKAAILRDAQKLQLQSIFHSDKRRACMLNNSMYVEGQQVGDFTIEKITPAYVVVSNGGHKFELKIEK
jgi:hypothetical protein